MNAADAQEIFSSKKHSLGFISPMSESLRFGYLSAQKTSAHCQDSFSRHYRQQIDKIMKQLYGIDVNNKECNYFKLICFSKFYKLPFFAASMVFATISSVAAIIFQGSKKIIEDFDKADLTLLEVGVAFVYSRISDLLAVAHFASNLALNGCLAFGSPITNIATPVLDYLENKGLNRTACKVAMAAIPLAIGISVALVALLQPQLCAGLALGYCTTLIGKVACDSIALSLAIFGLVYLSNKVTEKTLKGLNNNSTTNESDVPDEVSNLTNANA